MDIPPPAAATEPHGDVTAPDADGDRPPDMRLIPLGDTGGPGCEDGVCRW
ncbi:hypothetical protein [Streptantibioticus silvisoli]|uniref:Uncharacterized protein n=1 Tax=Streptantibioticus silvisoli TaxID=2705255 RepID=A0ABT6VT82_9ACTN|nr:hypothetical protein [Streptantibioticus silvisoli]MDI5961688.1 hypothetical protein [Streptantibioticus silvisoli]